MGDQQPTGVPPGTAVRLQQVLTPAGQNVNVLTTGAGQQFVITSQVAGVSVPQLQQVIPALSNNQPGVARILNITQPRILTQPLTASPSEPVLISNAAIPDHQQGKTLHTYALAVGNADRTQQIVTSTGAVVVTASNPIVGSTTIPLLTGVRRSLVASSVTTPTRTVTAAVPSAMMPSVLQSTTSSSPLQSPARKRLKLERKPSPNEDVGKYRRLIREHKQLTVRKRRQARAEMLAEKYYLEQGGSMMDYLSWRRRAPPQLSQFLKSKSLDSEDEEELKVSPPLPPPVSSPEVKIPPAGGTPVAVSTTLPPAVAQLSQQKGGTPLVPELGCVSGASVTSPLQRKHPGSSPDRRTGSSSPTKSNRVPPVFVSSARQVTRQHSISAVCDVTIGSREQIVERAKQEAFVVQRITELQREGLWSEKRLPKVQEPPRPKAHWDYLLEEMVWLAADFAQEKKWKKAAARKCARMVQKYFQDKEIQAQKAEKQEEQRLKKLAAFLAKEIKTFWNNVEKLVEYKTNMRLEEKRKQALDQHLSFIVDQTEKYSSWLTESMNKAGGGGANNTSITSSRASSVTRVDSQHSDDDEFEPTQGSSDDEETIAKAEEETVSVPNEVELLKKESEVPMDQLLAELPPGYLKREDEDMLSSKESEKLEDEEFQASNESESDDEATIEEQENAEGSQNHEQELNELNEEMNIPIEQLYEKYAAAYEEMEENSSEKNEVESAENELEAEDVDSLAEALEEESEAMEEGSESEDEAEEDGEPGLESLVEKVEGSQPETSLEDPSKQISDVAALAETFQPKGSTLSSTTVATPIPFLLKHSLREYQHIGLDWLVTIYDWKFNGILADEMGLGKTIQTIALLAHLACEIGNWGPHLVIVPTSVMLNWEMEFKKWCPGFKILTYYGTQKERRQKRTGWTKPNAFHVCITSYKLVIQDHQSFRRKKWKYLILDEAQNIKNFKSQRWQLLLNFQSQRRLLLTGTPLQNSLMELWSLMHFLMPAVFQSHKKFQEWFSNPVSGMIEGSSEYNDSIIKRLHKVLRPFLLRRLKTEVEKQLPKKYEHVVMCRLSKRQRFLYEDFMSRAKTRETLASGNLLSVINVLMQLRKVCNHPNLFEARQTVSPFQMERIVYHTASLVYSALDYDPFKHIDLYSLNLLLADLELTLTAFAAHRIKRFRAPHRLIEEVDALPPPPPRCPEGKIKLNVRFPSAPSQPVVPAQGGVLRVRAPVIPMPGVVGVIPRALPAAPIIRAVQPQAQAITLRVSAAGGGLQSYSVQLVQSPTGVKAVPIANMQPSQVMPKSDGSLVQTVSRPLTIPAGFAQLVQTSTGQHILLTSAPGGQPTTANTVITSSGQRLAVISRPMLAAGQRPTLSLGTSPLMANNINMRPIVRLAPLPQAGAAVPVAPTVMRTVSSLAKPPTSPASAAQAPITLAQLRLPANTASLTTAQTVSPSVVTSQPTRPVTRSETKTTSSEALPVHSEPKLFPQFLADEKSVFHWAELVERFKQRRKESLEFTAKINWRRCEACPIYGPDLVEAVKRLGHFPPAGSPWQGGGYISCSAAVCPSNRPEMYWSQTSALTNAIHTPEQYLKELQPVTSRFVFYVPPVSSALPDLHVSHPTPWKKNAEQNHLDILRRELSPRASLLHPIASAMVTLFPDPRLIQYDCGKLQVLDKLLRQLKTGHHRVLIFTQMTRMLDVLEAFLNYHGHIYLRLDGTTRVDQRQALMERFNADRRIFCFILSTRSGGIGVNLTGADTVIFYDSDWNPTMDAQAQDRCHRIGQTRDVHIYRLVSEKTVEENILKKANQKRLLGDVAIEGGNFTTAYFKKSTIHDLFNIDISENDAEKRMAEIVEQRQLAAAKAEQIKEEHSEERVSLGALESAMAAAEDDTDVQAAKTAKAEAAADLEDFDETIPLEEGGEEKEELSRAEVELKNIVNQLMPVERYAMNFVEWIDGDTCARQLAEAEKELEDQKREWEQERIKKMKDETQQEEVTVAPPTPPSLDVTFDSEDAKNEVWISHNGRELMPIWCPPTPPQDESDVYIDQSLNFLYERTIMSESQLPPIYIKREPKRTRAVALAETVNKDEGRRPVKVRKEDSVYAPRSLFDRPSPALVKMRRDVKLQKYRGIVRPPLSLPGLKPPTIVKPPQESDTSPEWLVHEDWALLQAIQTLQELPLNLVILSPGHTPNWDMVADYVNSVSRTYRSPKQCRNRYESIVVPREEGKILYEAAASKKHKKTKGIHKSGTQQTKTNRPMRTSQLFLQDNNASYTQVVVHHFETIKAVANKRTPTMKPLLVNPTLRNPKHDAVLAESGIIYDAPQGPEDVAKKRAARIAREKQKSTQVAAAQAEQLATQQRLQQGQQLQTTGQIIQQAASTSTQVQTVQQTVVPSQVQTVVTVSKAGVVGTQTLGTVVSVTSGTAAVIQASPGTATLTPTTANLRIQRPVTALTVQEMVAAANQARAAQPVASSTTQTVVSVANLSAAQLQGGMRFVTATSQAIASAQVATGIVTTTPTKGIATAKTLSPAQLQYCRQQAMLRQQQRLAVQDPRKLATAPGSPTGQKVQVAVTCGTTAVTTLGGVAAVQMTTAQQQHQRTQQLLKQAVATGKPATLAPTEVAALLKRQQQLQQLQAQQKVAQVQVPAQAGITPAQILAQASLQQSASSGQTPVATLVKTVSAPSAIATAAGVTIPVTGMNLSQVKGAVPALAKAGVTPTPQQIRQLAIHQQLLQQRKLPHQKATQLTQMGTKTGIPAQLIVQQSPGQKSLSSTVTVQQLQQVIKQVSGGTATAVTSLPSGQTLQTRVIPVSAATQQQLKQTIQVVSASPTQTLTSVSSGIQVDPSTSRGQLATALGGIKVTPTVSQQQTTLLSQVMTAALQGQPVSVAVRPAGQNPVRIQAPLPQILSVTAPGTSQTSTQQQQQQQQQDQQPR